MVSRQGSGRVATCRLRLHNHGTRSSNLLSAPKGNIVTRIALLALASGLAIAASAPSQAATLIAGQTGVTATAFDATTRGTQLAIRTESGVAPTIAGRVAEAVYANTLGGLDFYFQIFRTGGTNEIDGFNAGDFTGYTTDVFTDATDNDGAGAIFSTPNNGFLANGTASGSTTTFDRSTSAAVVRGNFGLNGLSNTENSTTYIIRTNATNYALNGFATVNNSTSFNVLSYMPMAATGAVPEPATWAMMMLGFGGMGYAMRRKNKVSTRIRFA